MKAVFRKLQSTANLNKLYKITLHTVHFVKKVFVQKGLVLILLRMCFTITDYFKTSPQCFDTHYGVLYKLAHPQRAPNVLIHFMAYCIRSHIPDESPMFSYTLWHFVCARTSRTSPQCSHTHYDILRTLAHPGRAPNGLIHIMVYCLSSHICDEPSLF